MNLLKYTNITYTIHPYYKSESFETIKFIKMISDFDNNSILRNLSDLIVKNDLSNIPQSIQICFLLFHTFYLLNNEQNSNKYEFIKDEIIMKFKSIIMKYVRNNKVNIDNENDLIFFISIFHYYTTLSNLHLVDNYNILSLPINIDNFKRKVQNYDYSTHDEYKEGNIEDLILSIFPQV